MASNSQRCHFYRHLTQCWDCVAANNPSSNALHRNTRSQSGLEKAGKSRKIFKVLNTSQKDRDFSLHQLFFSKERFLIPYRFTIWNPERVALYPFWRRITSFPFPKKKKMVGGKNFLFSSKSIIKDTNI